MKKTLILLGLLGFNAQAATFSLDAASQQPFYQSTLPAEVYQYTRHSDLADLHVFNGKNTLVPHAFISLPSKSTVKIEPLKFVTISEDALKNGASLRLKIEKNGSASNITIEDNAQNIQQDKQIYLIALKEKHEIIHKLKFNWDGAEDKLVNIEIASSDDLQTWQIRNTGNLLKTSNVANSILKDSLEFNDIGEKYLKITITKSADLVLTGITAEIDEGVTAKPIELESALTFLSRSEESKTAQTNIEFEATGRYPAHALSIKLPEANTVVSFTIVTRNKITDPWQHVTTGNAFQFNQAGQALNSPDVTFSPLTARYWRLQFNAAGGGVGAENPQVSLKFSPHMIVWNARGDSPFSLTVGEDSANTKPSHFALSHLMPEATADKITQLPIATLKLADTKSSAPMWQVSELESSYKPYYLWAGLGLGVLVLFGMAFSLLRKN